MKRGLLLLTMLFIFANAYAAAVNITHIRLYANPSQGETNRLVFDISGAASYTTSTLHDPERIVIDFKNARLSANTKNIKLGKSYIKSIRSSKKHRHDIRVVLDLNTTVNLKHFSLAGKKGHADRVVFDLTPTITHETIRGTGPAVPIPSNKKQLHAATTLPMPLTQEEKNSGKTLTSQKSHDVIVVIDPGHGGQDPGATGPRGTHEKNVTLAIGLMVREDLQKIPGIKVYMTRDRNVYPSLGQRLALARKVKADLYISIHADAYHNRSAHGATVFALSQGRATSVGARWIAESENRSELLGGVNLTDKSYMLRSVLVDLSQTATISESLKLGSNVRNNLGKIGKLHSHRVEQASLYVLTSPDIPSILVETGFISNLQEELLLNSPAYQEKLADAISQGIVTYLNNNPVPNTRFAS